MHTFAANLVNFKPFFGKKCNYYLNILNNIQVKTSIKGITELLINHNML